MRKLPNVGIAAVALSVLVTACSNAADEPKEGLEVGDRFPRYETFTATTIDGDELAFKDYEGKLLFVDLWASWCGPCRMELPYLKIVQDGLVGDEFQIVGISLDTSIKALRAMAKDYGLEYPQICDSKRWQSPYAKEFVSEGIPTNYLLDGNGVIIAKNVRGLLVEGQVAKALGHDTPVVQYAEVNEYVDGTDDPDFGKAITMLAEALEGDPDQPEFHFLAARLHVANGDSEKAGEHFSTGLKHKDKLPIFMPALHAYVGLGQVRLEAGDAEGALGLIDEAIEAIKALDDVEKETYSPFIPRLERLKEQWSSATHKH